MGEHELYIKRCFDIAKRGGKHVGSNPQVGSVIVSDDRIIGEGWHQRKGGPHAEVNAINSVEQKDMHLLKDATIYVTLEPCNHTGLTPPCTALILKHNIPRVCVSVADPNSLMSGKSFTILRENGIEVITDILEEKGRSLIHPFTTTLTKSRPYIMVKFACSKDHFIGQANQQIWISNQYSKTLVHKWRSEIDAIIIGTNTAILDNPKLTTRLHQGENPLRIVIDSKERIPKTHHLWVDELPTRFIKMGNKPYPEITFSKDKKQIIEINNIHFENNLMAYLLEQNIHRVMIEGGRLTIDRFVSAGLWDECRMIRSNTLLHHGIKAPNIAGKLHEKYTVDNDEVLVFYNEKTL